jgi:hypothetical protein
LTVRRVTKLEDGGKYTVAVRNAVGEATADFTVNITGKSDPPISPEDWIAVNQKQL